MKFMKKIFIALLFFVFPFFVFAENELSAAGKKVIDSFFDLRMKLSTIGETEILLEYIDRFSEDNRDSILMLNAEELLVLDNFIVMEKYNYLYQKPGQDIVQHKILGDQMAKIEKFRNGRNDSCFSKYFLCTQADITSCYMGFSVKDIIKYGTKIRPYYEAAISIDGNFCYALMNIGQWYYWAPKIAGGSKSKCREFFERAVSSAKSDSEKYYAWTNYSQILFELDEKNESRKFLEQAMKICPESIFLKDVKKANELGMSIFQYNKKNSKLNEEDK